MAVENFLAAVAQANPDALLLLVLLCSATTSQLLSLLY